MWNLKNTRLLKIWCIWNAELWSSAPSPCTVIGEWQLKELLIPVWFKWWPWKQHLAVPSLTWAGIRMCSVQCNPGDGLMACSPWVRNLKKQTVHLGFLAATLGLRSVPHRLNPFISFVEQTWLLQMCSEFWHLSEASVDKEHSWLSAVFTSFSHFLFLLHSLASPLCRCLSSFQFCDSVLWTRGFGLHSLPFLLNADLLDQLSWNTAALWIPTLLRSCMPWTGILMVWLKLICQFHY